MLIDREMSRWDARCSRQAGKGEVADAVLQPGPGSWRRNSDACMTRPEFPF